MKRTTTLIYLATLLTPGLAQDTTRLTLLFVGDIMQHDSQITAAYDAASQHYDYSACFQYVRPYIEEADIAVGNLELTFGGAPYKGYPQFSAPDELAETLRDAGFDILLTANNHSLDRGKYGLERTIRVLDSVGILHTGTFVDTVNRLNDYPLVFERDSVRIALLNYTFGTNGLSVKWPNVVNYIDTMTIREDLDLPASSNADFRIVFMHWGAEYARQPGSEQKELAEFCFKNGANVVIGSHPHVIQPIVADDSAQTLTVFSLGNFVSGQRKRYTDGGMMFRMRLLCIRSRDTTRVSIDSLSYDLTWVYRTPDAQQDYFIFPSAFADHPSLFPGNATSLTTMEGYLDDTRMLLQNRGTRVKEDRRWYSYLLTRPEGPSSPDSLSVVADQPGPVWFRSREEALDYARTQGFEDPELQLIMVNDP